MKTLIFSDTHLTHRFDPKKYHFLKNLIESADEVIINGDFWDGLSTSFDRFVNSKWNELFPLLKAKNTIYIYGNHDFDYMADIRVSLFSVKQVEEHYIITNPRKLILRHGHQHTPSMQGHLSPRALWLLNFVYEIGERTILTIFGKKFFQYSMYKKFTQLIHNYALKHLGKDEVLVCGHSHSAFFQPEKKYINSGFIRHGLAQYLIIENGKIRAVEKKY